MWFSRQHKTNLMLEHSLVDEVDLAQLRLFAEQVDCSAHHAQTLLSKQAGWLPTSALGSGMDYAESRVYQQGDDPRYMDWRVSARSTETFVKTYHMESRPGLCLVLDKRRTMHFGTRRRLKEAQAFRVAVMLAYAAAHHHIALNVLVIDDELRWVECFENRGIQASALLQHENASRWFEGKQASNNAVPSLKLALSEIQQQLAEGSLIYLVSDFMDLLEADKAFLAQLSAHHFVQAIHIMDPAELAIPPIGKLQLQDMQSLQTPHTLNLNTRKQSDQQRYSNFTQHQAQLRKTWLMESGLSYLRLMTDEDDIHQQLMIPLGKAN